MIKKTTILQVFTIGAIGIFIYGCSELPAKSSFTPSPEQMDKSPFTGIPCAAPCWYGLEVGKSNEGEAIAILPTLTFLDQESVQIYRMPSMPDYYINLYGPGVKIVGNCVNSEKECLVLTTANDVLQKIIVGLNYKVSPAEAIEYLNEPDYVGYGNLGSETVMCEVYLVWVDSRLILASRFEDLEEAEKYCYSIHDEGKVLSSLLIQEARYLSDIELDGYLASISSEFFEFTGTLPDQ